MESLNKQRPLFIGLSCLSIGCLIGSFAYPLQKLELYRQVEKGTFDQTYIKTFIITENTLDKPYGFDSRKAKKFAQIYHPATYQKLLLLVLASGCAIAALSIGNEIVPVLEIEDEINQIKNEAKKELKLKSIKHHFALANKSQQLLFLDEMKELIESFGSMEEEIMTADEINQLYEEANQVQPASHDEEKPSFRVTFPEQMDTTSWKACLKAMGDGAGREEIVKDVLGGGDAASAYLDFLKGKYL